MEALGPFFDWLSQPMHVSLFAAGLTAVGAVFSRVFFGTWWVWGQRGSGDESCVTPGDGDGGE